MLNIASYRREEQSSRIIIRTGNKSPADKDADNIRADYCKVVHESVGGASRCDAVTRHRCSVVLVHLPLCMPR